MARIGINSAARYVKILEQMGHDINSTIRHTVFVGAEVMADEIRKNIEDLPEVSKHKRKGDGKYTGIPADQKQDLLNSLGVAPMLSDGDVTNTVIWFNGYGSTPTKLWAKGLPNGILGAVVERGSSVRRATPFIRPAVNKKRREAQKKMEEKFNDEIRKIKGI